MYLAQGTPRLSVAVAVLGSAFTDPVRDIPEKTGLGRTKALAALSSALGATEEAVAEHLARSFASVADPGERAFVDLMGRKHVRFDAVARRDWEMDQPLLERLVEGDPSPAAAAKASLGSDGELDIAALAESRDAIVAALDAKDWSRLPKEAAELLGLSRYEALARVASELAGSPERTTQLLWDRYDPQYRVWIPFALVGFLAAIALAVFGRMARRWADMDA